MLLAPVVKGRIIRLLPIKQLKRGNPARGRKLFLAFSF
jgi:hypothetical protein